MASNLQPEKVYVGFLKVNTVLSILIECITFTAILLLAKYQLKTELNLPLWILRVFVAVVGLNYLLYIFNRRYGGGKVMESGSQSQIKQITNFAFPVILLLLLVLYKSFIAEYGIIGYIVTIVMLLFIWFLFYKRLKNKEEIEGKSNQSIFSKSDIIVLIICLILILGIAFFIFYFVR